MPVTVADLVARLSLNVSGLQKGLDDVKRMLAEFERSTRTTGDKVQENLDAAWKTLGVRPKAALDTLKKQAQDAYDEIAKSGTASIDELARAHDKLGKTLKSLSDEAMPDAEKASRGLISQIRDLKSAFDQGRGGAGLFSIAMTALTNPWIAAATAAGGLVVAVHRMVGAFQGEMRQLREMVAVSGLALDEASDLSAAMQALGQDAMVLQLAFFRMSAEITQGAESLNRLGISIYKGRDQIKTEGEALRELRDRVSELGTKSEQTAALIDFFGARLGRRLAVAFQMSREEFDRLLKRMGALSPVTDEMDQRSKALQQSQADLHTSWSGLTNMIANEAAPALTKWNEIVVKTLQLAKEAAKYAPKNWLPGLLGGIWDVSRSAVSGPLPLVAGPPEAAGPPEGPPEVQGPPERKPLGPMQMAAEMQRIESELAKANAAIDETLARGQLAAAQGQKTQAQMTQLTIAEIRKRVEADRVAMEARIDLATNFNRSVIDKDQKIAQDVQKMRDAHAAVVAKSQVEELNALTQGTTAQMALTRTAQAQTLAEVQAGAARELMVVNQAIAARTLTEEQGATRSAAINVKKATDALDVLRQQYASTNLLEGERLAKAAEIKSAELALDQARSDETVLLAKQTTARLAAEYDLRAIAEQSALADSLAQIGIYATQAQAAIANIASDPDAGVRAAQQANLMAKAQLDAAQQVAEIQAASNQRELDLLAERFNQGLLGLDAYLKQVATLEVKAANDRRTLAKATSDAEIGVEKAATAAIEAELKKRAAIYERFFAVTATPTETVGRSWASVMGAIRAEADMTHQSMAEMARAIAAAAEKFVGLDQARAELEALRAPTLASADAAEANALAWSKFKVSLATLTEQAPEAAAALVQLPTVLREIQAAKFEQTLESIGVQAKLLGPDFDVVGKMISALESRLQEMADTSRGQVTPAMADLAAQLENLRQYQTLRDTLADIFTAPREALDLLVEGVIEGTQDMDEAFKKLGQSIVLNFAKKIIEQVMKPLEQDLADFFTALIRGAITTSQVTSQLASGVTADLANAGVTTRTLPNGETVSVGVSSPSVLGAQGMGGFGGALSAANTATTAIRAGSAFQGAIAGWDSGWGGLMGAVKGAWGQMSGLATMAGYAAAALQGFSIIFDENKSNLGKGIQTATLAAGIALAYPTGGLSLFIAPLINWLEDMFGIFGKGPSEYELKRMKAADQANQQLGAVGAGYQAAARSGNINQVFAALQGGTGQPVRTELVLPTGLAAQIGITGQQIGDQIVTQWSAITLEQFQQVIQAFKEQPDLITLLRGSGDVPYLEGQDAAAVATQIEEGAEALLTAFVAMEKVRDQITKVATSLNTAVTHVLPPDLAQHVAEGIVNPIRDRMLAVLAAGLPAEEAQRQMEALQVELQTFVGIVDLYGKTTNEAALYARDLTTQTQGAIDSFRLMMDAATTAVEQAQLRVSLAVTGPEVLAANTELHDAIVARYQLEMQAITQIQAKIQSLLDTVAAPMTEAMTGASVAVLAQTTTYFDKLYASLAQMAMVAPTVEQKMFAIAAGIRLVVAASVPSSEFFRNGAQIYGPQGMAGGPIPAQITSNIMAQAATFLGSLSDLIEAAHAQGDMEGEVALLQQQAEAIQALGAAAVTAVQAWADAAIEETNRLADAMVKDINKNWDAEEKRINTEADWNIKNIETLRDKYVKDKEAEIKGIEDIAKARQEGIAAEIDSLTAQQSALEALAQTAREWEGVVADVNATILKLKLGAETTLNPADQLALAQATFDSLMQQFTTTPTAALAGQIQGAAQDLLGLGVDVLTRPSPAYQALFSNVVRALEEVSGVAAGQAGPITAADLDAQAQAIAAHIDALRAVSVSIGDAADAAVQAIRDDIDVARGLAQNALDWWNDWKKDKLDEVQTSRQRDLDLVEAWRQSQIYAITKTKDDEIDAIRLGTAAALEVNATRQAGLLQAMTDAQVAQLNALTGGLPVQEFIALKNKDMARDLLAIRGNLDTWLRSQGLPTAADPAPDWTGSGITPNPGGAGFDPTPPPFQSGGMIPRTGLYLMHQGERVTRASRADERPSITINITGATDPEATARVVRREVLKVLRYGEAGVAVLERSE